MDQFPAFPSMQSRIRTDRERLVKYSRDKLVPIPYWKLLTPDKPIAPFPIDHERPPTVDVVDVVGTDPDDLILSDDLAAVGYPLPPREAHDPVVRVSTPDVFGEAEHDQRVYRPFLAFGYVKDAEIAELDKFGKARKHDGTVRMARYYLELLSLEVESGDLFMWRDILMEITERYEKNRLGVSTYWTWLEATYDQFHGDSSNLEIPQTICDLSTFIGLPPGEELPEDATLDDLFEIIGPPPEGC